MGEGGAEALWGPNKLEREERTEVGNGRSCAAKRTSKENDFIQSAVEAFKEIHIRSGQI